MHCNCCGKCCLTPVQVPILQLLGDGWEVHRHKAALLQCFSSGVYCTCAPQLTVRMLCLQHFVQKCNEEFSAMVTDRKPELENMRLKERIAVLVRWRLGLTARFIGAPSSALFASALQLFWSSPCMRFSLVQP